MGLKAKPLMFLGTGSDVGKSILVAAFCRIFKRDGLQVAPFKAQNMALNSFITPEGGEMGRAQVVQAEAAGIEPHVDMNPILLKPTSKMGSQVIVLGKALGNLSAKEYYQYKKKLVPIVRESFHRLSAKYDVIVIEGAGSAVELNLKDHDLVNMAMAEMADARCILIGDIDRGGIFAALIGSYMLMNPAEQKRIIGFIVNKLRGDPELFANGVEIIEAKTGRPVLGVIPHYDHISIPEEDSVALKLRMKYSQREFSESNLAIGVVRLPFISNYTDFDCFEQESGVDLIYFDEPHHVFRFDAVILPGSKNTLEDLLFLQRTGLADAIVAFHKSGGTVVGICGGYQMLGSSVYDPHGVESGFRRVTGLGLLEMETEMFPEKITSQVEAIVLNDDLFKRGTRGSEKGKAPEESAPAPNDVAGPGLNAAMANPDRLRGYEIHMGRSIATGKCEPLFKIVLREGQQVEFLDGLIGPDGNVWGTYIHGIFDNDDFRRRFLANLQEKSGRPLTPLAESFSFSRWKEEQYNLLAEHVSRHVDVKRIYELIGLG